MPPIEDCRRSCVSAAKGKESRKEVHGDGERGTKNIKWLLRHASGAGIRRTGDKTFRARRGLVSVYLDGKATFRKQYSASISKAAALDMVLDWKLTCSRGRLLMSSVVPIEQAEVALALVASKRASPIRIPAGVAIFYLSMDKEMFFIKGLLSSHP